VTPTPLRERIRNRALRARQLANRHLPGRRPRWGGMRRTRPLSDRYGRDRGTPVDRYLIESFLAQQCSDVRGAVLEVKDALYTERFGAERVTESTVLDVDASNPSAGLVADLDVQGSLPSARFDCFILTQTLQYLSNPVTGLRNAWTCLRPDGVLLVSVPCVSQIDIGVQQLDRWRFTPAGLAAVLREAIGSDVVVHGFGNVLLAAAFLYGVAAEELSDEELSVNDPAYPLVACASITRGAARDGRGLQHPSSTSR
jgi:SAM-dependent methyltransferase